LALAAKLANPRFVVFDSQNNPYWSDVDSYRVRSVNISTDIISTVVGTGRPGVPTLGDSSRPASDQSISAVRGLAVDRRTNTLYFSDTNNHQVLRLGEDGALHRVAGTGAPGFEPANSAADASPLYNPFGLVFDEAVGVLYVCDTENNVVRYVYPATNTIGQFAGLWERGPVSLDDCVWQFASASLTLHCAHVQCTHRIQEPERTASPAMAAAQR
jgi:DNA-binding beta-propeller fold protein YncE